MYRSAVLLLGEPLAACSRTAGRHHLIGVVEELNGGDRGELILIDFNLLGNPLRSSLEPGRGRVWRGRKENKRLGHGAVRVRAGMTPDAVPGTTLAGLEGRTSGRFRERAAGRE